MIPGVTPFATQPFGTSPVSFAVPSPFSSLIEDTDRPRAYLLDAKAYDTVGAQEVDVGFSTGAKSTVIGNRAFPARLRTAVNSEVNLFSDEIGQGGNTSISIITLLIGDTEHDYLMEYAWDGRDAKILMGEPHYSFGEYQPIVVGTVQDIAYDESTLNLNQRNKGELLNIPVQETLYAGTGGLEGGTDLKGRPKPLTYGAPPNISPVLVDRLNLIYQWHDGSSQSCGAGYDGAALLTPATPADVADISTATPAAGQYTTQLSGSYIKLGAEPAKALTLDVQGDSAGGYVQTVADIVRRMVTTRTSLLDADLHLQSFSEVNTANSNAVNLYVPNGATVYDLVSQLMTSIGGSWTFNRFGQMVIGVLQFTSPAGAISSDEISFIERLQTPNPSWRRQLAFGRSWTVQPQEDVVSSASAARKDFVAHEYRLATAEDASIKTRRKLARSVELTTLLDSSTAAQDEANRQQALFGADRQSFRIKAKRQQFKYRVGQTITVSYAPVRKGVAQPRFGFPRDMIIMGLIENTDSETTEFRVWG